MTSSAKTVRVRTQQEFHQEEDIVGTGTDESVGIQTDDHSAADDAITRNQANKQISDTIGNVPTMMPFCVGKRSSLFIYHFKQATHRLDYSIQDEQVA